MGKVYNKKSKEDKAKEVDELLEKANKGIEDCFDNPEQLKELANYMGKFYNYSFRNTFLIQNQFVGAAAVGSYGFWKKNGFVVNKGEKGIKILVPSQLSDYFINSKGEEIAIKKANDEEKRLIEQGKIEVVKGKVIFNQGYVFEISQTNAKAEDLPKIFPNKWLDGEVKDYDLMYKAMENIAKKIGVKIIEPKHELGASKGASYPLTKEVTLNPRNTQMQNVKTLIHELAHAKLHTMETRNNYTTNAKEFQAELTAYTVCKYFGLDTSEYSFRYIKGWTKDVELKEKEQLVNEVRGTVKEYINVIEDTLTQDKELSVENQNENINDKVKNVVNDKDLYNIMEEEHMNEKNIDIQKVYDKWRDLVSRENWCKLELAGNDVLLKHTESEKEDIRKEFSQYAKLDNDITLEKMLVLENTYEESLSQSLANIDELESENHSIEIRKEYETLVDLELKDGSFIKKGTSFLVEGFENGEYEVHFEDREENTYIPDDGSGDMYYFNKFEIEKFVDLYNEKVILTNIEVETTLESKDWKLSEKEIKEVEFKLMKENIENLMDKDYGLFIKALISIEKQIEEGRKLDKMYEDYMDKDYNLINDRFDKAIEDNTFNKENKIEKEKYKESEFELE